MKFTSRLALGLAAVLVAAPAFAECPGHSSVTAQTQRSPAPVAHFEKVLGPDGLGEILGESDFVVLSSPLTDQTRGMIGAPQLRQMKPTAHLLNIARGGLTVEASFTSQVGFQNH